MDTNEAVDTSDGRDYGDQKPSTMGTNEAVDTPNGRDDGDQKPSASIMEVDEKGGSVNAIMQYDSSDDNNNVQNEPVIVHRTMPKYGERIVLPPGKSKHEEPAPYIGPGWICQITARRSAGAKADRFWLNADRSVRLRSIAEVERFLRKDDGQDGGEEEDGQPVRKKARTSSYDSDDDDDDDDDDDGQGTDDEGDGDGDQGDGSAYGPDPINPLINSAVALSRGRIHFSTAPQAAVGALLSSTNEDGSSETYAYSWDSILGLDLDSRGAVVGTAAMAQHLKNMQHKEEQGGAGQAPAAAAIATPSQIMAMIRSLRPRTCLPPDGSGMVEMVQNIPSENALWYGKEPGKNEAGASTSTSTSTLELDAEEVDHKIYQKIAAQENNQDVDQGENGRDSTKIAEGDLIVPYSALSRLYESMCQQDAAKSSVAGGESNNTFRRECRYMTAAKVVEKLKCYENTTVVLDKRERDTMALGRELGLLDNDDKNGKSIGVDVVTFLGY